MSCDFIEWLGALRFTGDVYAVPEGTPVFANEPILEIVPPSTAAQTIITAIAEAADLAGKQALASR